MASIAALARLCRRFSVDIRVHFTANQEKIPVSRFFVHLISVRGRSYAVIGQEFRYRATSVRSATGYNTI